MMKEHRYVLGIWLGLPLLALLVGAIAVFVMASRHPTAAQPTPAQTRQGPPQADR